MFQAEDAIRDLVRSRGLGDMYNRQVPGKFAMSSEQESPPKSEKRGLFSRWRRKNKADAPAQSATAQAQDAPAITPIEQHSGSLQEPLNNTESLEQAASPDVVVSVAVTPPVTSLEPEAPIEASATASPPVETPVPSATAAPPPVLSVVALSPIHT